MIENLPAERQIYSVSSLNREARLLLDTSFPLIWVEGEISNLRAPGSGHIYFSLKDSLAQVRCAMFRMRCINLNFKPTDGMQVLARAKVSLYEERGDFQLVVDYMEEAGNGALQRAFEALKKRLADEGLFNAVHKKPLPRFPSAVGVVTSSTGAAIRDILSVFKRRFPGLPVIIYPSQVQGAEAAKQIAEAILIANQRQECDVLIVARGGGSLEDLWPFNEEIVARAIFNSTIPVVSGVGHEIDFTIADFVADQRAPTPSAAAELVSPNGFELQNILENLQARINHFIGIQLRHTLLLLNNLAKRLQSPSQKLQQQAQKLDDLEQRLYLAQHHYLRHLQAELRHAESVLAHNTPLGSIKEQLTKTNNLYQRLTVQLQHQLENAKQRFHSTVRTLETVSPLNTLDRGYAIIMRGNRIIKAAQGTDVGNKITAYLAQGELECVITNKKNISRFNQNQ